MVFLGLMHKYTVSTILKRSSVNIKYNDSYYIINFDPKAYLENQTQGLIHLASLYSKIRRS
jgi:hypothetical protein